MNAEREQTEQHNARNDKPAAKESGSGKPHRRFSYRSLAVLGAIAVLLGLTWDDGVTWVTDLWALFAAGMALVQMLALMGSLGSTSSASWRIATVATIGLAGFWLLLVLPSVGSNASFLITAGVAAAGGALWLAPARPH